MASTKSTSLSTLMAVLLLLEASAVCVQEHRWARSNIPDSSKVLASSPIPEVLVGIPSRRPAGRCCGAGAPHDHGHGFEVLWTRSTRFSASGASLRTMPVATGWVYMPLQAVQLYCSAGQTAWQRAFGLAEGHPRLCAVPTSETLQLSHATESTKSAAFNTRLSLADRAPLSVLINEEQ